MAGLTPEAIQEELIGRGTALTQHMKEQSLDEFQAEVQKNGSGITIKSRLTSLGYHVQTSLSSICQVLSLLHLRLVDICEVMVYATLLLALGAMPLRTTSQFFRRQSNIQPGKGTKAHQLNMPKRLLDALPASLRKALESLSPNSFLTVTAGIQFLLDRSTGGALNEKVAKHFAQDKGDPTKNSAWERQLKNWGDQSLSALSGEERRKEEQRRAAGEKAARDATMNAVNCGGEFTIMPLVSPKSELAVSENGLIIGVSPSELLNIIASLMSSAAASAEKLKNTMSKLRASSISYGIRVTSAYQEVFQSELSRQLPLAQKHLEDPRSASLPTNLSFARPPPPIPEPQPKEIQPKMPPAPPPMGPQTEAESYSDQELLLMKEFLKGGELLRFFLVRH